MIIMFTSKCQVFYSQLSITFFVRFISSGACLLTFTDGDTIEEFTCNNISQGISMRETKSTYITLQLFNMENNSGGRFWIGFGGK